MKFDGTKTDVGGFNFEALRGMSYQSTKGAEMGECLHTISRIEKGNFESWITEWKRLADKSAATAQRYLSKGLSSDACHAFHRASNYYRMAEFYANNEDPRQIVLWNQGRNCFFEAAKLNNPPIEPIEIPYEGVYLPGYFVKANAEKAPTLVAMSGFDGSAEELYHFIGAVAPEHGWNCLIFEGPGQRGCLHINPQLKLRHDYEVPVKAVVDYAVSRDDVDADKLALIGYSLGGYLAPRAVAFEHRIKACVASSFLSDIGEAWKAVWPEFLTSRTKTFNFFFNIFCNFQKDMKWGYEHGLWAMDVKTPYEFYKAWEPFTLLGLQKKITCPIVSVLGVDEIEQTSKEVVNLVMNWLQDTNVQYYLFDKESGGAAHCQIGNMSLAHAAIFDWLNNTVLKNDEHYFPLLKDIDIHK